jgi:hypothetical protein
VGGKEMRRDYYTMSVDVTEGRKEGCITKDEED